MERIVYNKTLDVHKNGVQFVLQGFETADKLSRRLVISLMASGDAVDFPLEQIMALMYVGNEEEPYECEIKDNTIIYDVLPITEEGITEMQLKIIETRPEGANCVLATPKFAIEVLKSNADDESVQQTTKFTALEDALARAKEVYDKRFSRMELSEDCIFRAFYADGTVYETDVLKRLFNNGNVLLSQSFAKGGSGVRAGEDTDNSMYYSNVSKSASLESKAFKEDAEGILADVQKHGLYTGFSVDFTTGEVEYVSPRYDFKVNEETGELEVIGKAYTFEGDIHTMVDEWLLNRGADVDKCIQATEHIEALQETDKQHNEDIVSLQNTDLAHTQRLDELQDHHTWKTIGSVSFDVSVDDPLENDTIKREIEFNDDLPEDFDITSYSKYRFVVKQGSQCTVHWTARAAYSGTKSNSEVRLLFGTDDNRKDVFVFGVGNKTYGDTEKTTKNFELSQDMIVAEDNITTELVNGTPVWRNGNTKMILYAFSGAGSQADDYGHTYGTFTIELQVRK